MKRTCLYALLGAGLCASAPLAFGEGRDRTDTDKISSAMSAAPAALAGDASIWDYPTTPGQQPPVLRIGSNGWTCFPDNPATPGNDPMCLDKQWLEWMDAYLNRRTPNITAAGVGYMLQGGSETSNTDPFATAPAAGESWMASPPHIMLLNPQQWDRTLYPTAMDPRGRGPWIMFPDTPYEHLMVPVEMPMSAAPASRAIPATPATPSRR